MLSLKSTKVHPLLDHLNSPLFDDVVICGCSGQGIETSRFMLGSLSPLLHSVLVEVPNALQTSIIVADASEDSVKHLFKFMADEEINRNETDYHSLLDLMLLLGIDYMDKCCLVAGNSKATTVENESYIESETDESMAKLESEGISVLKIEGAAVDKRAHLYKNGGDEIVKSEESGAEQPEVIHSCEHCEKCFASTEFLRKHIKASHGQGALQCDKCGYSTNMKFNLKKHIAAVHEKALKHRCDICSKPFSSAASLKTHKNTVHLKMRNFACNLCGKAFSQSQHLVSHRRQHTGEKPFVCGNCGRSFSHITSLKFHEKSH